MRGRCGARWLTIVMSVCLLIGLMGGAASANSAQAKWQGSSVPGVVVTDTECPIEVVKEVLTFELEEFPESYYSNKKSYLDYAGKVTAAYTFYNPADYAVTATLLFPFGNEPDYACVFDRETEEEFQNVDTEKYGITVNGDLIEKTLRYTYGSQDMAFLLERDLKLLQDEKAEDAFYKTDLQVTKYSYRFENINVGEGKRSADAECRVQSDVTGQKIYFERIDGLQREEDGAWRVNVWAVEGDTLDVYVLGKDLEKPFEWEFRQIGADRKETTGTATLLGTETMTFDSFALSAWKASSGVSETDWYNAVLSILQRLHGNVLMPSDYFRAGGLDLSRNLMRWYEYEITLEPGEQIVNTVTAPIYPAIDSTYRPALYTYQYLLSPAKTWASFGDLEIRIETPFYLVHDSESGFVKTAAGYQLQREGLPEGELTFSLSEAEEPMRSGLRGSAGGYILNQILQFWPLLVGGLIVMLCIGIGKEGRKES